MGLEVLEARSLLGGDPFNFASTRVVLSTPDEMRTMASADFDGDSDLDLVVAAGPRLYALRNNGNGGFAPAGVFRVDGHVTQIAFGDFDADGKNDFAAIGPNGTGTSVLLRVFRGNNDGTFVRSSVVKPSTPGAFQIHVSNFDSDTRRELLVVFPHTAAIYQMNAGIPNSPRYLAGAGYTIADVAVADMDFDGVSDLVLGLNDTMNTKANISVWLVQPSSVGIVGVTPEITNAQVTSVATANLFGSSRPDIIMGGRNLAGVAPAEIGIWTMTQTSSGGLFSFGAAQAARTEVPKIGVGETVEFEFDIYAVRQLNGGPTTQRDIATYWKWTRTDTTTKPATISHSSNFLNLRSDDSSGMFSSESGGFQSVNGDLRIAPLCGPFQTANPTFPDLMYIQLSPIVGGLNKVRYAENIYPT